MVNESSIAVTVCYGSQARQMVSIDLQLAVGSTVADALRASHVLDDASDSQIDALTTGVWGRRVSAHHALRNGDRVELYRPLKVDPKMARRERFVRQGARGTGLFSKRRAGAKSGY